jgi:uncharacterized protein YuzE
MRWSFDVESQSLYLGLSRSRIARQVEMDDGVVVDIGAAGEAIGIEIIRSTAPWDYTAVVDRFGLAPHERDWLAFMANYLPYPTLRV